MLNEQGGINGRRINLISLDDGYSPPKTIEAARRLVEQEEVLPLFGTLGTPTNSAIHRYMNLKKVPQLFVSTGAGKWNDPEELPLDDGLRRPAIQLEGRVLRRAHPADQAQCEDRPALPERRLRQGLPDAA
jgi:hypothetical protein